MNEWRERWQSVLADLERQRDELKVKIHLARAESRDELARLEDRLAQLRLRTEAASGEARGAMKDIGEAADRLVAEIRQGFDRVRKTL